MYLSRMSPLEPESPSCRANVQEIKHFSICLSLLELHKTQASGTISHVVGAVKRARLSARVLVQKYLTFIKYL